MLKHLRQFADAPARKILEADLSLSDVQFALALYYGYESWPALKHHVEMQRGASPLGLNQENDGSVCIRGLENLDWGGSFFQRQNVGVEVPVGWMKRL